MIRDTVCCFLGISLARKFGKVFKVKPMIKAPPIWSFDSKNPHSITRWAKFVVEGQFTPEICLHFVHILDLTVDEGANYMFGYMLTVIRTKPQIPHADVLG